MYHFLISSKTKNKRKKKNSKTIAKKNHNFFTVLRLISFYTGKKKRNKVMPIYTIIKVPSNKGLLWSATNQFVILRVWHVTATEELGLICRWQRDLPLLKAPLCRPCEWGIYYEQMKHTNRMKPRSNRSAFAKKNKTLFGMPSTL